MGAEVFTGSIMVHVAFVQSSTYVSIGYISHFIYNQFRATSAGFYPPVECPVGHR